MPTLNSKFYIKFYPKDRRYKRMGFLISVNQLPKYIGKKNAAKVIELLQSSLDDKFKKKLRKFGELHIYGTK